MVFLGTVTESLAMKDGRVVRARMRIDRAYKGVSEKSLVLFDDGMCDGPNLQVGEQYLMYTRRVGDGDVPSRGCTRSRHVKLADEDLKYLSGLSEARPAGTVFGNIVVLTDDGSGRDKPVVGAVVEVSGAAGSYATTTDDEGRYSVEGLEPDKYTVSAEQAGLRTLYFQGKPPSTFVEARGCAVINLSMRKLWRGAIEGRVIRANGEPASAGIELTLIRLENRGNEERWNALFNSGGRTNERGEYSFAEVSPGRYKVVMNLYRFPSEKAPYPTIYWPGSRTEAGAVVIEVTDEAAAQHYDFRLPTEPRSLRVAGIVLRSNGEPVEGAQVQIVALPDNNLAGDNENRPETDETGHFAFTAFEGFEYVVSAVRNNAGPMHSEELRFSLGQEAQFITVILDRPGRFDGDPMGPRGRKN